ncbi:MAG TPA: ubiquinol oxidase subunit II [Stellaceae bacterium]|nr:ubiquinol oxidase subunit II [Stellaceae bacterium]
MQDWRHAAFDAPRRLLSRARPGPRRLAVARPVVARPALARRHLARWDVARWDLARWGVVGVVLLLAACQRTGVIDPQGPIGAAEFLLLLNATAIMLVVVVPVILATLAFAWWFRSSNARAKRRQDVSYEGRIDFAIWSIPAMIVILLGGVNWIGAHQLDPRAPIAANVKPLDVEVASLDWKWLFIYPDQGIATVNQLVIPARTPVRFALTSATVMNSFFVPELGSQIYTMPGMTTHLSLLADKPGEYPGISANFSGNGFSDMRFVVTAVSPDKFAGWVAKVRGSGAALDLGGYAALAKPSQAVPPRTYRAVAPRLFERIVDQTALDPEKAHAGAASVQPAHQAGG